MKIIKINLFFLAFLLGMPSTSFAGWFGPRNYDECILESLKGVTSDVAATMISRSCREKFPKIPKTQSISRILKSSELGQITGRAGPGLGNYFQGNLYNGNSGITVSQITFIVTTRIDKKDVFRTYVTDVNIPPHASANFSFEIIKGDEGSEYSWGITGGRGY